MSTIDFLKLNNHTKTCENVVLCAAYCDHEAHSAMFKVHSQKKRDSGVDNSDQIA